jgi:hypothetical protein
LSIPQSLRHEYRVTPAKADIAIRLAMKRPAGKRFEKS